MGTRSNTDIMDGNKVICRIYRQYDGYPEGHGVDLAKLCDVRIVNGFSEKDKMGVAANGMQCLAAQIVAGLKTRIGNVYLQSPEGEIDDWVEYLYTVRQDGDGVKISIATKSGERPFNLKKNDYLGVWTPKELLKQFAKREAS